VVPLLGNLIGGDAAAYSYLPASSAAFAEPEQLAEHLRELNMVDIKLQRLGFGAVAIVSARVRER
jgi:demethylmenaquinone methyltransferase / 2-methoxy-6-polyprenyl-1,4-benzoquinol methylase